MADIDKLKNRLCRGAPLTLLGDTGEHWYSLGPGLYLERLNVNGRGLKYKTGVGCGAYLVNEKTYYEGTILPGLHKGYYVRYIPFDIIELEIEKIHS